jgi:hypothetical protein
MTVTCGRHGLRVRDTGVGMGERDPATALERFRQGATSPRFGSGGTGLGGQLDGKNVCRTLISRPPLCFAFATPSEDIQASSGLSESCPKKAATYRNLRSINWQRWCRRQAQ